MTLSWSEDKKRASEDRRASTSSREPLTLEVTPSVPKAFIPRLQPFGDKMSLNFIFFHFQNYFVTGSDVMITYIPASCFNYMINEKNQKQGVGFVGVDKVLTFWWIKILVEIILTCVCLIHTQADRPVHAVTIAAQPLTLHVHQQNMHTSVLPVFVVKSAWAHWPNFPVSSPRWGPTILSAHFPQLSLSEHSFPACLHLSVPSICPQCAQPHTRVSQSTVKQRRRAICFRALILQGRKTFLASMQEVHAPLLPKKRLQVFANRRKERGKTPEITVGFRLSVFRVCCGSQPQLSARVNKFWCNAGSWGGRRWQCCSPLGLGCFPKLFPVLRGQECVRVSMCERTHGCVK